MTIDHEEYELEKCPYCGEEAHFNIDTRGRMPNLDAPIGSLTGTVECHNGHRLSRRAKYFDLPIYTEEGLDNAIGAFKVELSKDWNDHCVVAASDRNTTPVKEACENCSAFAYARDGWGVCRAHPPTPLDSTIYKFPEVTRDQWCREWAPKDVEGE